MDDIRKNQIYRFLQRFGIRIIRSPWCKFSYDRENFSELSSEDELVIFDVGANIGQSSIWLKENFPNSTIYAFEPFPTIYGQLRQHTLKYPSIKTYNFALGKQQKILKLPKVKNFLCQTAQVAEHLEDKTLDESSIDTIAVRTLDDFCLENSISIIHILKTDTEGYDLEVLEGAKNLLREGRVMAVLSEASIVPEDKQHTNLFKLKEFLAEYNFELFSLYELRHQPRNGRLDYFNALFKREPEMA